MDHEAEIHQKDGAKSKCCHPRSVPFALHQAVEKEPDRLEDEGVNKPVQSAEWASPKVIVRKHASDYEYLHT